MLGLVLFGTCSSWKYLPATVLPLRPQPQPAGPVAAPVGLRHIPSARAVQAPGAADPRQLCGCSGSIPAGAAGAFLRHARSWPAASPRRQAQTHKFGSSLQNRTNSCEGKEAAKSLHGARLCPSRALIFTRTLQTAPCLRQRRCALLKATP